jgi:hypothetical protein
MQSVSRAMEPIEDIIDITFNPLALLVEPLDAIRDFIVGGCPGREFESFALECL